MKSTEAELINLIRQSDNPIKAIETATKVILGFLAQPESSPTQEPACPQELD